MQTTYLWAKTFHLLFVVAWMAAVFYLPRILVNLEQAKGQPEVVARLTGMGRRLYRFGHMMFGLAVLLGLLLYYVQRGDRIEPILIYVAVVGSIMVSYTRARAEGLGVECKEGLFTRFERVILLVVGLVVGVMRPVLWVLAILTVFTAIQRIYSVWRKTLS